MITVLSIIQLLLIFAFGMAIASFLNAQIYRLESKMSWWSFVTARSHCEKCNRELVIADLVPLLSYLYSRGSCRTCGYKIPLLYPVSELILGVAYLYLFLIEAGILVMLLFTAVFFLALYDYLYRGFPKVFMHIFLVAGLLYFFFTGLEASMTPRMLSVVVAGVLVGAIILLNYFRKSFGAGDLYLILFVSFFVGIADLFSFLAVSFLSGAVFGVVLIAMGMSRKSQIPFVPFMALGVLLMPLLYDWSVAYLGQWVLLVETVKILYF